MGFRAQGLGLFKGLLCSGFRAILGSIRLFDLICLSMLFPEHEVGSKWGV